jgi:DNA-binding transcriptional MerR regulator
LFETVDATVDGDDVVATGAPAEPPVSTPPSASSATDTSASARVTSRPSSRAPAIRRAPAFAPTLPADDGDDALAGEPGGDGRYTRAELAAAAGVNDAQVTQLESFGLLAPAREINGEAEYDDDALEVARITAGFFARGVEGRHLRMYRTFAEREAVLFGQVLLPYVRQRNPEARQRLQEELAELASLGRQLRTALLREAVRETLAE